MTVIKIMGAALDAELQDRGIFSLSRVDCEAIIARVIERTAECANAVPMTKQAAEEITERSE
jgi:hypothetical protein